MSDPAGSKACYALKLWIFSEILKTLRRNRVVDFVY
jgi:hypothetical protein